MSIQLYPSIAKIKRNGVYENLPGFVPETGSIATQQMIATSESSATAQYVHNKGEYFRLNDTLYQAIVKINVGDAIVVGTNCEVAVLGNDVTHIANSIAEYELGIATSAHATGEYFMVGETLYVATDDIQIGNTISTSTNCKLAIVGNELSGLKSEISDKLTITHGKNLLNPAIKIANTRMYAVNTIGSNISTTTLNGTNIIKLPVEVGEIYTLSHIANYVIGDVNNKAVTTTQSVGNYNSATITIPENSYLLWVQVTDAQLSAVAQVEKGNKRTFYQPYKEYSVVKMNNEDMIMTSDIHSFLPDMPQPTVVNTTMTKSEFIAAFNTALDTYATFNEAHIHSFLKIPELSQGREDKLTWEEIFYAVNHDLRKDVVTSEMSMETACQKINNAFTEKIYRFSDARLSDGSRHFSLSCNFQADEPSAVVIDDKLYIYAHLKRIYTEDGVTWSQPENIVLSDSGYIMHVNINYIDGVYYMIGTNRNSHGDLILYTSTDGVNFTYQGILFKYEFEFSTGKTTNHYGNAYLIKEYGSGKFYLYIESQADASWEINLAIFDDFTTQNQDGTIGAHTIASNNPIISRPYANYRRADTAHQAAAISAGNPDFAKLCDNKPLKHNGMYYMYIHSTWASYTSLIRMKSYDLINWTEDGVVFDNRDIPSAGEIRPGNADQCVIEYKGRTYLFYSYDINDQSNLPYIKYTVDDRPFHVMLDLLP